MEAINEKIKTLLILGLVIFLASCQNDSYVSVRHPQGEEGQVAEEANTEDKKQEEADLQKEVEEEKTLAET